jgi:hypothetical protein
MSLTTWSPAIAAPTAIAMRIEINVDRRRLRVTVDVDQPGWPWTFVFPGEAGSCRPSAAAPAAGRVP